MSDGGGTLVSLDKRAEFFRDFMKTVLSLSTGAIVFSVTFLHDVLHIGESAPGKPTLAPRHTDLLICAWMVLLVSVVASLLYLFFHALSTKYERAFSSPMNFAAVAGSLALVAGLLLLIFFGVYNVPG